MKTSASSTTCVVCGVALEPGARFLIVKDPSQLFLGVGASTAGGRLVKPARLLHADRPRTDVLPA